ncbi:MAG: selenocysteine-specific translation elongation factor [Treponema sp.]|nr:selenocysteine-specific translation elongation factor [Treponema sp.]
MEYPFILGTAGHIDHGKTSLVKALTGVDCDRLEEEKRRGITIELGFAPLSLPSGKTVSIIDVPGHERFIRQMAAGASGMDAAMLVIAATESVMPQTREHLDILNLLGVRCGLVALTKKDLVDNETLEIAVSEIGELIAGSCLSGAVIIPVSSTSGEGIPRIVAEIENLLNTVPPRKGSGAFFLPIDRLFNKKGFGCVVTGTVWQGSIAEGDEVQIMPSGVAGRVRSLQIHGAKAAAAQSGQRAAINISAVSLDDVERGDAVCAKGAFIPTRCISAHLDVLPSAREGIAHWQRLRLHAGTVDVVARISLLRLNSGEGEVSAATAEKRRYAPGSGGPVQILPESEITITAGQRFVVRLYSPLVTIGGGRVLLPNASLVRSRAERARKVEILSNLVEQFDPLAFLAALVHDREILSAAALSELSQMEKTAFAECLDNLSRELSAAPDTRKIIEFGKGRFFISYAAFDAAVQAVQSMLKKFHADHPERTGLDAEKLYPALEAVQNGDTVSGGDFKDLLAVMAGRKIIAQVTVQGKICYCSADFSRAPDEKFMALISRASAAITAAGFNLPTQAELEAVLGVSGAEIKRATAYLREQEDLRSIDGGFLFSRAAREKLLTVLAAMQGDITVATLRDVIGASRKYTVPMLDFFDTLGITRREGDKRVLIKSNGG